MSKTLPIAPILLLILFILGCSHPESGTYSGTARSRPAPQAFPTTEEDDEKDMEWGYREERSFRNVLPMEVQNGVRYVWIEINGIRLRFIFDTGASSVCISPAEVAVLFRQGTLQEEDVIGTVRFQDATGRISEGTKINLRTVRIGHVVLENIEATVIDNVQAPLLLGQTVFERFGKIAIDNEIIFE